MALLLMTTAAQAQAQAQAQAEGSPAPTRLQVVGGLADVRLYQDYERSFWREELPRISEGRLQADIVPFDSSGIRGQDMLHLLRLGVVSFGTVLLSLAANTDPELAAPNLALLAPDISMLRRVVQAYRPYLTALLKREYGVEMLAVYAYPAQVLFCTDPLPNLESVRRRRVRVSNYSQADVIEALGGHPVVTTFASQAEELQTGRVDCVITGSLSGNQIGLHRVARQVHPMALSWGLSIFAANRQAWDELPQDLQLTLRRGLGRLELNVWAAAGQDTEDGFLCNAGRPGCQSGTPGTMAWNAVTPEDETARRRLLSTAVIPGWIARCGESCRQGWNTYLAPLTRIFLPGPGEKPDTQLPSVGIARPHGGGARLTASP
ncbi:TRAP transporter substrate-binding protein DctP [Roseomonas marmotae]|uniref:TRAP transporter substrate-binding protein DctP n=1 Tax=Roseomonas marmotae TaxID=2768161 RepID=A0ABS3K9A8_9PROT|nr:TRAP transporter substrate-binding protein DctP [Roseomonas marmotae]MBO1074025.1 TRAP transporter substrate-binding protein DctP [Roseomonas marmotae]QTI78812.1 TRAP transporter substrate-binding protein DctP [Roseomonas marmotae]